jgi:uncharacterized membrane protein
MEQDGSTNSIRIDTTQLGDRELQLLETLRRGEPVTRNVNDGHNERLTSQSLRALRLRMEEARCLKMRILARVSLRITMSVVLATWIALNVVGWIEQWDPYPFILLNLALSFQAAYAAPVIMMSQNRQEAKDRLRSEHDYETDCKAELVIMDIHKKVEDILALQKRQLTFLEQSISRIDEPNP